MENLYKLYPQTKTEKELVKKSFLEFHKELGLTKNASVKEYIDTVFEKFLQGDYSTAEKLTKKLSKTLVRKDITSFKSDFERYFHYNPIYAMASYICYQNSIEAGIMQNNSQKIILNYIKNGGNPEIFHLYNLYNIEKYMNDLKYVSFMSSIDIANKFRENFLCTSPLEILFALQYQMVKDENEINRLNQQLLSFGTPHKAPNFIKSKLSTIKGMMSNYKKNFNNLFDKSDVNMVKNITLFKDKYLEIYDKIKNDTNPKTACFHMAFLDNYSPSGYYPKNNTRIYNKINAKTNSNSNYNTTPSQ